jgi:hypothetical protein
MSPRHYSVLAAVLFAVIAALQLARAVLGWPVALTTPWGTMMMPLWPNWIAFAVAAVLAWLGFKASRS